MIQTIKNYETQEKYFNHQLEKTLNHSVKKRKTKNWKKSISSYIDLFKNCGVKEKKKCICIGSRYGQEVNALRNMNCEAIGVDLTEFPPYTIVMDMHDLKYDDNEFDVAYSNALDHSWNINKAISEMFRVSKEKVIIHILLKNRGNYDVVIFDNEKDIIDIVDKLGVKYNLEKINEKRNIILIFNMSY